MANWSAYKEAEIGLPVFKRAKHGLHFTRPDGLIQAEFTGKPCHYLDGAVWRAIDTKLIRLSDGWYGSPHSDVRIHPDGRVSVTGSDYQQFTVLPSAKTGVWDGDKIIRTFPGGEQHLVMKEDGFKEEIHVFKPTFPLEKFIAKTTGSLPSKYKAHPVIAMDANDNAFTFTGDVAAFGAWLEKAVYPVVIDPDFAVDTADGMVYAINANYTTARSTATDFTITGTSSYFVGQRLTTNFYVYRVFLKYDTSSIGAGSTVTQANLKMGLAKTNESDTDFDIQIVKQNWSSQEPITDANKDTVYDNCLSGTADDNIFFNTSSYTTNQLSGNLSTTWVSKTGATYYSLRSSRDLAGTEPSGDEYFGFYPGDYTSAPERRIFLVVTYEAAATGYTDILRSSILDGFIVR